MSGKEKFSSSKNFERSLDLIMRLQSGERLTASDLAGIYGVTLRTGQRLLRAAEAVLPVRVVGGKGSGGELLIWQKIRT